MFIFPGRTFVLEMSGVIWWGGDDSNFSRESNFSIFSTISSLGSCFFFSLCHGLSMTITFVGRPEALLEIGGVGVIGGGVGDTEKVTADGDTEDGDFFGATGSGIGKS